eukprot:gb/GEZN01008714.1/.p1 GENE.gb/GEZN01008714.1/~~gb/GEZN01008714.1/.p1  ORF type:complete len:401 (+),score=35.32 gb/GEZN01008714.1/:125-1327(+)
MLKHGIVSPWFVESACFMSLSMGMGVLTVLQMMVVKQRRRRDRGRKDVEGMIFLNSLLLIVCVCIFLQYVDRRGLLINPVFYYFAQVFGSCAIIAVFVALSLRKWKALLNMGGIPCGSTIIWTTKYKLWFGWFICSASQVISLTFMVTLKSGYLAILGNVGTIVGSTIVVTVDMRIFLKLRRFVLQHVKEAAHFVESDAFLQMYSIEPTDHSGPFLQRSYIRHLDRYQGMIISLFILSVWAILLEVITGTAEPPYLIRSEYTFSWLDGLTLFAALMARCRCWLPLRELIMHVLPHPDEDSGLKREAEERRGRLDLVMLHLPQSFSCEERKITVELPSPSDISPSTRLYGDEDSFLVPDITTMSVSEDLTKPSMSITPVSDVPQHFISTMSAVTSISTMTT